MESVTVIGKNGFIGKHLCRALEQKGIKIVEDESASVVYHLASPATTEAITKNTLQVVDTILDVTRNVIKDWPNSKIVYASSMGAEFVDTTPQGAYNVAKLCMEIYLQNSSMDHLIYRLPAVYGPDMHKDHFIKRCIDGTAYKPAEPEKVYYIAHVDDVVEAMINLKPLSAEAITLGEIYEQFTSGRRGLYRPAPNA